MANLEPDPDADETPPWDVEDERAIQRLEAVEAMKEMDPDVLVGDLEVTSEELIKRFPDLVARWLRRNIGG